MTLAAAGPPLWIVGTGRAGLALALMLHRCGVPLVVGGRAAAPPRLALFGAGGVRYLAIDGAPAAPPGALRGVVLAVPDAALAGLAAALAAAGLPPRTPVLHLSGSAGAEILAPLAGAGHPVGGLHPLVALAGAEEGAARLRGAAFGVEAGGDARVLAEEIVGCAAGRLLEIAPGAKPVYHAAAVFASNYVVALLDIAERLLADAGLAPEHAREVAAALARGAADDVARLGPAGALTGPIARGDAGTVELHLLRLSGAERRVYSVLGRRAVELARQRGLDPDRARQLELRLEGEG